MNLESFKHENSEKTLIKKTFPTSDSFLNCSDFIVLSKQITLFLSFMYDCCIHDVTINKKTVPKPQKSYSFSERHA